MPLAAEVLFDGQTVDAYPEPFAVERVEARSCMAGKFLETLFGFGS